MYSSTRSGFVGVAILTIAALAGVLYVVKDEKGVSYLESTYKEVRYLIKGRSEEAIEKAKEAKQIMQKRQNEIQKNIDSL
jgi:3-hydroxyacyl-CoA dehydrogenase